MVFPTPEKQRPSKLKASTQRYKLNWKKAMPPYHPILGHIPLMINIVRSLPRDFHGHYIPGQMRRRYPDLGPIFYLDAWPLIQPFLVITSPTIMAQYSQASNYLPKHPGMRRFMRPITGGYDLVSIEGQTWKKWRKMFSPGFSASHMMTLVPCIVEEIVKFRDLLSEHAEKCDVFSLDELAINATMDVIGKVAM